MKKLLLILSALVLSVCSFAQNRTYMGAYNTDNLAEYGLGMTKYAGHYSIFAELPTTLILPYQGAKVLGMRFALADETQTNQVQMLAFKGNQTEVLAEANVKSTQIGWNEVLFDTPFTLDLTGVDAILLGYDYEQTAENFPIAYSEEGRICNTYLYGNLGGGEGFYNIGMTEIGNLAVQVIVEKEFDKQCVYSLLDMGDIVVKRNETATVSLTLMNAGTEPVKSLGYVVTRDGKASTEQQINLSTPVSGISSIFYVNIPLTGTAEKGCETVKISITKVNGQENPAELNYSNGDLATIEKPFTHKVAVEEFTGTTCGYCPRGWQGMENLRQKFGDAFVGIAIHQYSQKDPMFLPLDNYNTPGFSGAPSCVIERGEEIDPYYGSNNSIVEDFQAALDRLAPVSVKLRAAWNADKTAVNAYATLSSAFDNRTYDIEYVLIGDGLKNALNTSWKQANNYYNQNGTNAPDDLKKFCSGGKYGKATVALTYNDVALSSSYENGVNTVEAVNVPVAYEAVESQCTLKMPSETDRNALCKAIIEEEVYAIVLVVDQATGRIVNADKVSIGDANAIEDIVATPAQNNVILNLSGQRVGAGYKGIVIKNGRKYLNRN